MLILWHERCPGELRSLTYGQSDETEAERVSMAHGIVNSTYVSIYLFRISQLLNHWDRSSVLTTSIFQRPPAARPVRRSYPPKTRGSSRTRPTAKSSWVSLCPACPVARRLLARWGPAGAAEIPSLTRRADESAPRILPLSPCLPRGPHRTLGTRGRRSSGRIRRKGGVGSAGITRGAGAGKG